LQLFHITSQGKNSQIDLQKKEISEKFDMHTRDLRPVYLSHQLFTISVRGEAVVVNLGKLKLIIGIHETLIFPMKNERKLRKFLEILSKKLQKRAEEDREIPFEFIVLETAFTFILKDISKHFDVFEKQLEKLLEEISESPSQKNFGNLLLKKKEILLLEKPAQEIKNALYEVLEEEDEIEELWISKNKHSDFEEDDVESILENLLEQVTEISHKLADKKENIDDTQEIITLKLSSIRNTIIQYDLLLSAFAVIFSGGTLVSGFFGMNLLNHQENNQDMFFWIVTSTLTFSLIFLFLFFILIKKKRIWQN